MSAVTTGSCYCPSCVAVVESNSSFCLRCGRAKPVQGWPADPLLQTVVLGRFKVDRLLGQGGFGSVYEVMHTTLGGRRALKVLKRDLVYDEALLERFEREARALYQLNAPQLVKVEEYGYLPDGRPFMIMELALGERLDRVIRRAGWLPPLRCIRITREILLSLTEAHGKNILHRDLKAENVMVHSDPTLGERVKVLDLGIARILGDLRRLTSETRTLGTPEYMSPEQWRGEDDIDDRADLYAVGILMYEMLTGDVPFPRKLAGPAAIYNLVMTSRPPPISRVRNDLPGGLEAYVFRMVARDYNYRPVNAVAALEELEVIRAQMG